MLQHRPVAALVPALVAILLTLAGCGGGSGDEPSTASPTSTAASTTSAGDAGRDGGMPSASPTDEEPPAGPTFAADTSDDGGPAQAGTGSDPAGQMHVPALRLAAHEGYDRLVLDLNAHGVPRWTVRYTEASGPGGGPVEIAGDAFLRVELMTSADPGVQVSSQVSSGSGSIAEAKTTGFFEGYEEVLIGVRGGELPFRAIALTDPGRIVIDVRPES